MPAKGCFDESVYGDQWQVPRNTPLSNPAGTQQLRNAASLQQLCKTLGRWVMGRVKTLLPRTTRNPSFYHTIAIAVIASFLILATNALIFQTGSTVTLATLRNFNLLPYKAWVCNVLSWSGRSWRHIQWCGISFYSKKPGVSKFTTCSALIVSLDFFCKCAVCSIDNRICQTCQETSESCLLH